MSWLSSGMQSILIFSYFVVFTVWVPSWLIQLDKVATLSSSIKDLIAVAAWGGFMTFGIVALRSAQKRGWI
jgi:hypothetical protein